MRIVLMSCMSLMATVVAPGFNDTVRAEVASSTDALSEIIVTAERVASTEGRTPISMTVLGQNELSTKGIVDFVTLAQQDPSVNFDTGNGSGYFTLRGVSGSGGIGPAIPISFDGFFYNVGYIFNNVVYDVDRIEILRGPQGTLFGRNASGGLINLITNDPTKEFGGYGELTLGNYNTVNAEGGINLPFSDTLQFRASFASAQHSGYRSLQYGGVADDEDAKSGRAKLAWQPTEHLNVLATFQSTHVGGAGGADNIFLLPADANNLPTHVALPLTRADATVYGVSFASEVSLDDTFYQLRITYDDLPFGMSTTYLGGYDTLKYLHTSPTTGINTGDPTIPNTIELLTEQDPKTINQELRLVSAQGGAVTWQAGLYYFRANISDNSSHFRDFATPGAADLVSFPYNDEQTSKAVYGQANYHLGDVTLSAGLRYTKDYVSQFDKASPSDGNFPALSSVQYSKLTWHAGADWRVTEDNLLYAKADTGYRAGAFNLEVSSDPTLPSVVKPYSPETVTAYEIGSKNKFLDDHVSVNADVFYMNYSGEQLLESNQNGVITVNARSTKIKGAEAQVAALVNPVGRIDLNVTLLRARFGSQLFTNAVGQTFNIGGNQLTQAPDISATLGVEHEWNWSMGKITPRIETKYQSGQYFDFYNVPDSHQAAYTTSNAHLLFNSTDGRWLTDFFVRNIENTRVFADESESFAPPITMPGTYNVGYQAPRTYGVRIRAKF